MRQDVNLHQPLRRRRDWLAPGMFPMWAGALALVLGSVTAANWQSARHLEQEGDALAEQVEQEQEAVEALQAEAPTEEPDPDLQGRVEALEDEIAARKRLGARVGRNGHGPWQGGFAPVFDALTREAADDVWLERIVAGGEGQLRLEGGALRAKAVPEFVDQLGREPEFLGKSFGGMELRRPEDNPEPLRFILRGRGLNDE